MIAGVSGVLPLIIVFFVFSYLPDTVSDKYFNEFFQDSRDLLAFFFNFENSIFAEFFRPFSIGKK